MLAVVSAAQAAFRFVNVNLWLSIGLAAAVVALYAGVVRHHYNRGWAAHEQMIAAEIASINKAREDLISQLSHERMLATALRQEAAAEAIVATQAYCREHPEGCGIELDVEPPPSVPVPGGAGTPRPIVTVGRCAAVCVTPPTVRAKLNAIK